MQTLAANDGTSAERVMPVSQILAYFLYNGSKWQCFSIFVMSMESSPGSKPTKFIVNGVSSKLLLTYRGSVSKLVL